MHVPSHFGASRFAAHGAVELVDFSSQGLGGAGGPEANEERDSEKHGESRGKGVEERSGSGEVREDQVTAQGIGISQDIAESCS